MNERKKNCNSIKYGIGMSDFITIFFYFSNSTNIISQPRETTAIEIPTYFCILGKTKEVLELSEILWLEVPEKHDR